MRLERDGLSVGYDPKSTAVFVGDLILDVDTARWLAFLALPSAICAVSSDPPAKVQESGPDDGQIPGQLAIEG